MLEEKNKMLEKIAQINAVEGFDSSVFAAEYSDLETGEKRKKLPVAVLMAMFRMKYPEGKITVTVAETELGYCATARVYPSYKDAENEFLAEATTTREPSEDKKGISVIEWAQTAAIGIALRNAGFGLQYAADREDFSGDIDGHETAGALVHNEGIDTAAKPEETEKVAQPEQKAWDDLSLEEKYKLAVKVECPIGKYKDKTLGDLLLLDQHALKWIAESYQRDESIRNAAIAICEYAQAQQVA